MGEMCPSCVGIYGQRAPPAGSLRTERQSCMPRGRSTFHRRSLDCRARTCSVAFTEELESRRDRHSGSRSSYGTDSSFAS